MNTLEAAKEEVRKLRDGIRDAERQASKLDKIIESLSPEKAKPKGAASPASLPDRLVAQVTADGKLTIASLCELLVAPIGPVKSATARLVKQGRLAVEANSLGVALFSIPDANPFSTRSQETE